MTVRLRHATELGYRATWSDGGSESSSAEESAALQQALADQERAAAEEAERERDLDRRLQSAMETVARARLTATETAATTEEPATSERPRPLEPAAPAVILARTRALLREPDAPLEPRRSRLRVLLAWLWALVGRLFARLAAEPGGRRAAEPDGRRAAEPGSPRMAEPGARPQLPASGGATGRAPPAPLTRSAAAPSAPARTDSGAAARKGERKRRRQELAAALSAAEALDAQLAASRARLDGLAAEREDAKRRLERHRSECARRILSRLRELWRSAAPVDVEVAAPHSPDGVLLLVRDRREPSPEAIDGTVAVPAGAPHQLRARVLQIRDRRPAEIGRRLAAALCSCRNQIVDLEERGRQAHQTRVGELDAQALAAPAAARDRELGAAQRPVAQQLERIVDEAATELERLVEEVRRGWQARIAACDGIELLRAEVAAIEDGAAHRLSLVCDELRERMTVRFVRLVLELSRSLRQDLLRKRHEVARGRSPKVEETFDDVRLVLPASLDTAFAALRAPELGELMTSERSLFNPLFRTVARQKRECESRLNARLDDIQRTTARELYASAVLLSPVLLAALGGLIDELLTAHASWIAARLAEEARADEERTAILRPALELVEPLAASEARLAALLEASAGSLGGDAGAS